MDQQTQTPAPDHERPLTIYRFCAQHKLYLSTPQRIAIGQELTQTSLSDFRNSRH